MRLIGKIIKEKLNDQELNEFYEWLKIAESERMSEVRNAERKFRFYLSRFFIIQHQYG